MSIVRHALLIQPIGIAGASSSRPLRASRLFVLTAHIATTGAVEKATSGNRPATAHSSVYHEADFSEGVGLLCTAGAAVPW